MTFERKLLSYPSPMLPGVDYQVFSDDVELIKFESDVMKSCMDFFDKLKEVLIIHQVTQTPEYLTMHLGAYVGALMTTVMTLTEIKKLTPKTHALLKKHAGLAYEKFMENQICVTNDEKRSKQIDKLTKETPGSIGIQTLTLGLHTLDMLGELGRCAKSASKRSADKNNDITCPQSEFFKFLLPMIVEQKEAWQKTKFSHLLNYTINQVIIQTGWLIGYYDSLSEEVPSEREYLDFAIKSIDHYSEQTAHLIQGLIDRKQAQSFVDGTYTPEDPFIKSIMKETYELRQAVCKKHETPAVTDFQKQTAIVNAAIEKGIVALTLEGRSPHIVMMSLYYFWFELDAPLRISEADLVLLEEYPSLDAMTKITRVILETINQLPEPDFSQEQQKLARHMDVLRTKLPNDFHVPVDNKEVLNYESTEINSRFHTTISDFLKKDYHPEVLANVLFSHWVRLSMVCENVSEKTYHKVDHYFPQVIASVRTLIPKLLRAN